MFEKYKILLGKKIEFAMQMQKTNSIKCLIVVDKKDKFIGTLSDGDIRNAILKKFQISKKIDNFVNRKPCFFYENEYQVKELKKILFNQEYPYIPIINNKKKVVNVFDLNFFGKEKIEKTITIPVVIMAGGKGTRLQPLTHILPKPLIPMKGKAIIEHIISEFKTYGASNYFISLNYKSQLIKAFFSELKLNCKINYLNEKKPMGTAGCLKLLQNKKIDNFFVINCDTIIKTNLNEFLKFHKMNKNDISVIGAINKVEIPYGVCEIGKNQKLKNIDEKPKINFLTNTGCYLVNKKVLKLIPKNKYFDFTDLITLAISKKYKVGLYPIDRSEWIDVGNLDHISRLNEIE